MLQPDSALAPIFVVAGLALLILGANLMVRYASRLGLHFGLAPVIVGATIIAFGTSAPEFVVSFMAALSVKTAGSAGGASLAIGNVAGSNVVNLGLVVGTGALLTRLKVAERVFNVEYVAALLSSTLLFGLALHEGGISQADGSILLGAFVIFLAVYLRRALKDRVCPNDLPAEEVEAAKKAAVLPWALLTLGGLAILLVGSDMAVNGALRIASDRHWDEGVVGATIVALGTSLPELATALVAAFRRHNDVAVGSILGSNIFNALFVIGPTAMVQPLEIQETDRLVLLPAMIVVTIVAGPLLKIGSSFGRRDGLALLLCYAVFLALCILRVREAAPI